MQRWVSQWVAAGRIVAQGEGRARRYLPAAESTAASDTASVAPSNTFPANIPLSTDSQDILAYVIQPLQGRKPVAYLQLFADINKRTSRLAANLPLFRANLCPLTFLDVPEQAYSHATLGVYELTRVELLRDLYVWAYERSTQAYHASSKTWQNPTPPAWPTAT